MRLIRSNLRSTRVMLLSSPVESALLGAAVETKFLSQHFRNAAPVAVNQVVNQFFAVNQGAGQLVAPAQGNVTPVAVNQGADQLVSAIKGTAQPVAVSSSVNPSVAVNQGAATNQGTAPPIAVDPRKYPRVQPTFATLALFVYECSHSLGLR